MSLIAWITAVQKESHTNDNSVQRRRSKRDWEKTPEKTKKITVYLVILNPLIFHVTFGNLNKMRAILRQKYGNLKF